MAKTKKASAQESADAAQADRLRRFLLHALAAVVLLIGCGVGVHYLQIWVDQKVAVPTAPPKVVLKERPGWMSDSVAAQIAASAQPRKASVFDHKLLENAVAALARNPWVRQVVQVRRAYGQRPGDTLEIDCQYRAPVALVHWMDYYWLVDGEGFKLPEQYKAADLPKVVYDQDRHMNLRVIEGVRLGPPESGHKWSGDDLPAGLDVVKLLYGRDFAEDVVAVDVSNFQGRREARAAQIVLVTRYQTQLYWGRPIDAKDFFVEVPVARKLEYLKEIYRTSKRIDAGHRWIDLRFDKPIYPLDTPTTTACEQ